MKNPMMPFGEEPSTLSLDMPPGLTSIMQMASPSQPRPTGITSNLGVGPEAIGATQQGAMIPSYQEGGIVGESAPRLGQFYGGFGPEILNRPDRLQRRHGLGGNPGVQDFINRDMYGNPKMPDLEKMKQILKDPDSVDYSQDLINEAERRSQARFGLRKFDSSPTPGIEGEPAMQQPSAPSGMGSSGGGGGGGYPGMPRGGGFFGLGGMLPETRKKPTVTVEEIKTPTVTVEELGDTSYAEGGMVGMEGMRVPPGAVPGMPMQAGVNPEMQAGTPMNPQMMEMQINQFVNRNPQQVAMIRQSILEELQTGELTPQELNMIVQLATVAAQNPEMYSYVRNFAIQQGIASEDDLPAQYDQGLVFVLLLAARAVQQDLGGAPVGTGQAPGSAAPVVPSMARGGKIASSGESKPVIIEAHTGEYVIPKHVVDMKGKEFFDSLVEKYKDQK